MSYTILLVDDDPDLLPSLVTLLEELSDFQIITAQNGLEGLERVIADRPDCVVIDVLMPELNGYQLVQALRGDPATADTPLVILSALAQEQDQWIGLAVGVDHYLTKPVNGMHLIASIRAAASRSRADRQSQIQRMADEDPPMRP